MNLREAKGLKAGREVMVPYANVFNAKVKSVRMDSDPRVKCLVTIEYDIKDSNGQIEHRTEELNYKLVYPAPVRM